MASGTAEKQYAAKVVRRLAKHYPDADCTLDFDSPLQLLIATILAAQCTDKRVNQVTPALFAQYPTAADFAAAKPAELEKAIQSTGFFRNKAKNIQAGCRILAEEHGGEVPKDLDALVRLPGIGRKTANVVLGTAYGLASGVVVDTHVTRLSRRLGLTTHKNAEKIEEDLMRLVPRKQWVAFAHRLVHHGRRVCTARKPQCDVCPLGDICPRIGVEMPDSSD